jgi:hypothetical protein
VCGARSFEATVFGVGTEQVEGSLARNELERQDDAMSLTRVAQRN